MGLKQPQMRKPNILPFGDRHFLQNTRKKSEAKPSLTGRLILVVTVEEMTITISGGVRGNMVVFIGFLGEGVH